MPMVYVNPYLHTETPEEDKVVIYNHQVDFPLHTGKLFDLVFC